MDRLWATKCDHFSEAIHCCIFIVLTMLTQMTLHQPGLGMMRIDAQNSIDEDFSNVPTFF